MRAALKRFGSTVFGALGELLIDASHALEARRGDVDHMLDQEELDPEPEHDGPYGAVVGPESRAMVEEARRDETRPPPMPLDDPPLAGSLAARRQRPGRVG